MAPSKGADLVGQRSLPLTPGGAINGSPGMNVGQGLVLGLKAPALQGFRGSGGLLGDAHVW